MHNIRLLLALAGTAFLCGCDNQTQVNTQKIDVLTQKIFILEQAQAKQLTEMQSQLAGLPPLLNKMEDDYFTRSQDKALFYHTNSLYLLLAIDKKIQAQFKQADDARETAASLAYYYHTNQTDTVYFCARQIADAMNAQEKRIEDSVITETRQLNTTLGDELAKQIKLSAPDKTEAKAQAAKLVTVEARLAQMQRDLDQIKTLLANTNPPVVRP